MTLDVRRHVEPGSESDREALSDAGVRLAKALGTGSGAYAIVASSPRAKARETAMAIAGRVDEVISAFDVASDDVMTNAEYAALRSQESLMAHLGENANARAFALGQLSAWSGLASRVPPGAAVLIVTHGANIELPTVQLATLLGIALATFPLGYGEGVSVMYERGELGAIRTIGAG